MAEKKKEIKAIKNKDKSMFNNPSQMVSEAFFIC